ncbi:MAG TPA: RNA-guided endonuclease IscB [Ktedonobacterales bacterium]|nr:RNA-guided endonuclease IscB [Ktedonobacterales bacterium]
MQRVFVVSPERTSLSPCRPARARWLLTQQKAAVLRRYPFTIILRQPPSATVTPPLRVKLDPGSRTTGIAVVNEATGEVVWAAEVSHRRRQVKDALDVRRAARRGRRQRHTHYRPPRFDNRTRPTGWLPPSLASRVHNVVTWVERLRRYAPLTAVSLELVRFDPHLIEHPETTGIEYQQGTLAGWEVREYLLLKWGYRCAYCQQEAMRWEVDHIVPRSRGGSNRVSNLALACHACNQAKGDRTATEYGHPEVQAQAGKPLKDAAAINSTRWALYELLQQTGLPVETGTGGRTKWNRTQRGLPKTHWTDAACVGASTPMSLRAQGVIPLAIQAMGRYSRQMCRPNAFGFPDKAPNATSVVGGFRTGDMVRASVPPPSVKTGTYVGRIAIRATGSCNLKTTTGTIQGIHYKYCRPLHRGDGYTYERGRGVASPRLKAGVSTPHIR